MNRSNITKIVFRSNRRLIPCNHHVHRHNHNTSIPAVMTSSNSNSKRQGYIHRGVKDPIALPPLFKKPTKLQEELLTAIKERDTRAVYKAYMTMKENNELHLLPKIVHSMALQSFRLKDLVVFQPHDVERYRVCITNILEQMEKHPCTKPDVVDYNFVLEFYGRGRIWRDIHPIWKKIKQPDTYSYNCYMFAANRRKHYNWTLQLIQDMKSNHVEPDDMTYNLLIEAHGGRGDVTAAERVFQERFVQPSLRPSSSNNNGITEATLQQDQKRPSFLQSLFQPFQEEESTRRRRTHTTMSMAAPLNRIVNSELKKARLQKAFQPTKDTFIALIKAYGQNKKAKGLKYVHKELLPQYKIEPDRKIYNSLVEWYVHSDRLKKARDVIREMEEDKGMKPDVKTFNYLFRYEAKKCNRPGIAEKLIRYMQDEYQLQPLPSMYKTLINNHNENRRLEEAKRLFDEYVSDMSFNRHHAIEEQARTDTVTDADVIPMKQT